ncbi:MAG: Bax inhibitor-1/YccA family protein [Spirochaetales bacterium]|nr:Bax inhibitor-1/YccA family protein [Spirochaetales bacterium]MCF7937172.1 Bax inhibitor-1/YccA family protein [Spirochaetales bacterium]
MPYSRQEVLSSPVLRENTILKNVYTWMAAGLGLTGVIALLFVTNRPLMNVLMQNPLILILLVFAEFGLVIFLSARLNKMSAGTATLSFIIYAALNGITLSVILFPYTGGSIAVAFFVTAGTFAAMSIYGMTTRKSLSGLGRYLIMGLVGIIIASVVNWFLQSPGLYWIVSFIGVFLFMGLTAYDTQMIKRWSHEYGSSISEEEFVKLSVLGALKLYLDFINLFILLLRFFGRR